MHPRWRPNGALSGGAKAPRLATVWRLVLGSPTALKLGSGPSLPKGRLSQLLNLENGS
jgi:hypothetical protein